MASIFSRRIVAYIADFFVVSAFMWIISFFLSLVANPLSMFTIYSYFPFVVPVVCMIYFVLCEKIKGATVGKALMYLEVKSYNGRPINWAQANVRNLTKIFWIPIIFDWAIGKIIRKGDRLFNVITKTVVIEEEVPEYSSSVRYSY